jgi:cytochrome c oxidase cbb3-type subunit 2
MTLKKFLIGTIASFGLAWLLVVVLPFVLMRNPKPVEFKEAVDGQTGVFIAKTHGRVADGLAVYQANGCALCHTQVIRPTYAGTELWRQDWAGLAKDEDRGDTRRESNVFDYSGLNYAPIGQTRVGEDLSNLAVRMQARFPKSPAQAEAWLYRHLYNPRSFPELGWSICPSMPFLFEEKEIRGQGPSADALQGVAMGDKKRAAAGKEEIVPGSDARALISYLMSLRHDHKIPASINYAPPAAAPAKAPAAK